MSFKSCKSPFVLRQDSESFLLGTKEAIAELSSVKTARLLVISDSHGFFTQFQFIVQECGKFYDALVFCGDGAHDLKELLSKSERNSAFKAVLPGVIAFVRGNNDPASFFVERENANAESFTPIKCPNAVAFTVASQSVFCTHGHEYGVYSGTEQLKVSAEIFCKQKDISSPALVLFGHTHTPYAKKSQKQFVLNPGSISLPRNSSAPSFASVELSENGIEYTFSKISREKIAPYTAPF